MAEHPLPPARARFRTLAAETSIPIEADDLIGLAKRYADQGMFDESIHLYEMAEKLKPGSVALRINLARVRDLKRVAEESRFVDVRQEVMAERARDEIDSSQYAGLAQYYMAKDQTSKAIELLEIAKLKTPNNYRPFEILDGSTTRRVSGTWHTKRSARRACSIRSTAVWPRWKGVSSSS